MKTTSSSFRRPLLAIAFTILGSAAAHAGTPLICQPYSIGDARCLPGATEGLRIDLRYDRSRLIPDTLALLEADVPVIVRMETLRRAALYATSDERGWSLGRKHAPGEVARAFELLHQLRARMQSVTDEKTRALVLFDFGFFAETLRHAGIDPEVDGYTLLTKARELHGPDAAMEFALALASSWPKRKEHADHLAAARQLAKSGTLIADNLSSHFR